MTLADTPIAVAPPGPADDPHAPRRADGFTLLELVLVMLVIAVAAAIVAPSISGFAAGQVNESAAASIQALSRWASERAVDEARAYRLHIDNSDERRAIYLTAQDGGTFVYPGHGLARDVDIPVGVRIEWVVPFGSDGSYVTYRPDGTHDPMQIRITGRDRAPVYLAALTPTEPLRVLSERQAVDEGLAR